MPDLQEVIYINSKQLRNVHRRLNCLFKCLRLVYTPEEPTQSAQQKIRTKEEELYIFARSSYTRTATEKETSSYKWQANYHQRRRNMFWGTEGPTNTLYTKDAMNAAGKADILEYLAPGTVHVWTRKRVVVITCYNMKTQRVVFRSKRIHASKQRMCMYMRQHMTCTRRMQETQCQEFPTNTNIYTQNTITIFRQKVEKKQVHHPNSM